MNLAQALSEVARRQPNAPAIIADGAAGFTYAELDAAIRNIAAVLAKGGVARGDVVGVGTDNKPLHLLAALALSSLGALALPIPARLSSRARGERARRYGVARFASFGEDPAIEGIPMVSVPAGWRRARAAAPADPAPASLPWIVVMSSGTTGTPKAIAFRQEATIEYSRLLQDVTRGGSGPGTRMLCFGSLQTAFVLRPCMRHLLYGGALLFMRTRQHREAIDLLRRRRITHATLSPPLLASICRLAGVGGPHLPDMQHLAVGGATVPPNLMQLARSRLTPHVYVHYGASEAGLVALADPQMSREHPASAGRLMSWLQAEAVDEQGRALAAGQSGMLRFRGKSIAREYFRDPEASSRVFRDGWFYSGDAGSIGADGVLRVEGRVDERINLGGAKFNPEDIERVINGHPLVRESAVFASRATNGELRLCAVVVASKPLAAAQLREHCGRELSGARLPTRFFGLRSLPRNANGKLLRGELPVLLQRARARRNTKRA